MELFTEMLAKRPESALAGIKYVHIWFHEPIYDGRQWESGGDGKLRYFDTIGTNVCCCFLALILKSAAQKLNLTLEYAEVQTEKNIRNSILSDYFGNNVKNNIFN